MARNSHTITKFKGINTLDSVPNVSPDEALDCLNVYGDTGGWLSQFQQPTILLDWSGKPTNLAAANSLSQIATPNAPARLVVQQGNRVMWSDSPYSDATLYDHDLLAGIVSRLDWAYCNGILFGSNGQDNGYFLSSANGAAAASRFKWGIEPPDAPTLILASTTWVTGSITIQRTAGVTTITFSNPHGASVGSPCFVDSDASAPWPIDMQGVWRIASTPTTDSLTFDQALPDSGPWTRAAYPSGITATTGWQYGVCYGASPVAHWSSLSPLSATTGPVTAQSPIILIPPTTDWQVDQVALFRNQDGVVQGGGLWQLDSTASLIATGDYAGYGVFCDTLSDEDLATSGQTAPYDNGVAPAGKYLAVWLDRVLMCGILDDPTGVRFTGYDTIGFGRPQMSWCQFNEIKLGQGQATPLGMGLLRYGGMIFFATNGFMYVYRGSLNDISVSAPVSLSFYAEQLPYNIGLYSHFTIQSTPAGLVWLDDGFNLRIMDNTGFYPPKTVAPNLTGLFKRITPGSRDKMVSVHINYLQNDWYILSFPIDGSTVNNMTVVVDVSADPAKNTGAWPTNHSVAGMTWVLQPDATSRMLAIQPLLTTSGPDTPPSTAGYLTEIPFQSPINQGIVDPAAIALNPPNPPMPNAFWRGGYFGIHDEQGEDEFSLLKLFRYVRLGGSVSDGIVVRAFLVNGQELTWDNPAMEPFEMDGNVGGLNMKARCLSPLIQFPDDTITTLSSLIMAWNVASER